MRTQIDSYNVYNYSELSSKSKEVAESEVKECTMDVKNDMLHDAILENLKCLFPNSRLKVQYSLSYCQGDGLNIYGELNTDDLLNYIQENENGKKIAADYYFTELELKRIKHYLYQTYYHIPVPENASRYSYDYSDRIDIAEDIKYILLNDLCYRNVDKGLIQDIENIVKDIFHGLNSYWENEGYEYLYNVTEDELNDYEFYENGKIYGLVE